MKEFHQVKQPSCFFDWLGLGGVKGVKNMIERDFHLDSLEFVIKSMFSENNYTPIHEPTGFRFQHDFGITSDSKKSEETALTLMQNNTETTLSKYSYLADRTKGILSSKGNIGLVYHGRTNLKDVQDLVDLLTDKYESEFYFVNVINEGTTPLSSHPKVITFTVDNSSMKGKGNEWQGSNRSWDMVLSNIKINKDYYLSI